MCDVMNAEDDDVEDDEAELSGGVDGGDEGEEYEEGVRQEKDPGNDLFKVVDEIVGSY